MSVSKMLPLIAACVLLCMASVHADDEDRDPFVHRIVDLSDLRTPQSPRSPALATPADCGARDSDSNAWDWFVRGETMDEWIPFDIGSGEGLAVDPGVIRNLVYDMFEQAIDDREDGFEETNEGLLISGPAAFVQPIEAAIEWARAALVPPFVVETRVAVRAPEQRLLAQSRVRLAPGRWTRAVLQTHERPFTADWNIEVAQESVSMNPVEVELPEGQEVYLRYLPGESVSLVEVWMGVVEHLEVHSQDLSVVRNVPEGNASGAVEYPTTRVDRAHTVLALAAGGAQTRRLSFEQAGRRIEVELSFPAVPGSHPARALSPTSSLAVLKSSALGEDLTFAARESITDAWLSRIRHAASVRIEDDADFGMNPTPNGTITYAPKAALEMLRASFVTAERTLESTQVTVRLVTVPEVAYRKAVEGGELGLGRPVAGETLDALRGAGASADGMMTMPMVVNTGSGFRLGASVPGLLGVDSEVAQQSAGLTPVTGAMFRGLSGSLRYERRGRSRAVVFDGSLQWADPDGGRLGIVFRPPVSMDMQHEDYRSEPDVRRTVTLPLLGGGRASVRGDVVLEGTDTPHLLAAIPHGAEVHVLLVEVR